MKCMWIRNRFGYNSLYSRITRLIGPQRATGSTCRPIHVVELILGLLAIALVLPMATRRLPIPPASALILGGMLLAAIPGIPEIEIHPDLVMLLFLPPLLLASAAFTVWRDFRAQLRPILMLAIGAVIFTTWIVGCAAKWVAPSLPWAACFCARRDRVAARCGRGESRVEHLPLPRRIVTILEGESLVNDASGLLLYKFAVAAALTGTFDRAEAALTFVWLSSGGVVFGYAVGRASIWIMARLRNPHENVLMTFLTAWPPTSVRNCWRVERARGRHVRAGSRLVPTRRTQCARPGPI